MSTETAVKERGWPAYTHEVRAILDGRQSQFRRALWFQPNPEFTDFAGPEMYAPTKIRRNGEECPGEEVFGIYSKDGDWGLTCPFGKPGDRLWLKEKWAMDQVHDLRYPWHGNDLFTRWYAADDSRAGPTNCNDQRGVWRSSVTMPRWASRITLEVVAVRVERVQEITEEDIKAEGVRPDMVDSGGVTPWGAGIDVADYHGPFIGLWDSVNTKRGFGWLSNPWTWVVSFQKI